MFSISYSCPPTDRALSIASPINIDFLHVQRRHGLHKFMPYVLLACIPLGVTLIFPVYNSK